MDHFNPASLFIEGPHDHQISTKIQPDIVNLDALKTHHEGLQTLALGNVMSSKFIAQSGSSEEVLFPLLKELFSLPSFRITTLHLMNIISIDPCLSVSPLVEGLSQIKTLERLTFQFEHPMPGGVQLALLINQLNLKELHMNLYGEFCPADHRATLQGIFESTSNTLRVLKFAIGSQNVSESMALYWRFVNQSWKPHLLSDRFPNLEKVCWVSALCYRKPGLNVFSPHFWEWENRIHRNEGIIEARENPITIIDSELRFDPTKLKHFDWI